MLHCNGTNSFKQPVTKPDLSALLSASSLVGKVLSSGDIVIYESTVYPSATEEECCLVLSKNSGLNYATSIQPNNDNIFILDIAQKELILEIKVIVLKILLKLLQVQLQKLLNSLTIFMLAL